MAIKNRVKIGGFVVSAVLAASLASCSFHRNPLKTADPSVAAQFLVSASQGAEKQLHVFHEAGGYYYGRCMLGEEKKSLCTRLYKSMADYAKTTPNFRGVTVRDLTDAQMFKALKVDYQRERFNTI